MPAPARARSALAHGAALLLVALATKALVLGLRALDGNLEVTASAFTPFVLIHEDLLLALAVAALALLAGGARAFVVVHAALAAYLLLNLPVARFFATPLTYGLWRATGGALADSVAREASASNVAALALLLALAVLAPRIGRALAARVDRGHAIAGALAVAGCLGLGLAGRARVESAGLHRNAIFALARTSLAARAPATVTTAPPGFSPRGPVVDLSALRGRARGHNVLWVVLESTAARYLGAYGATPDPTPHLSALAREALIFDAAYAAYPESIKGLHAQLCATSPAPHTPIEHYDGARLPCASIAAALHAAGYRTGLFHSGRFAYLGMEHVIRGKGFDVLVDAAAAPADPALAVTSFGVDEHWTVARLLDFVAADPARPFFAMYLPIAGHHPYHAPHAPETTPPPFPADGGFGDYRNDLHRGDRALGALLAGLRARGRLDDTLILVVGDHGEAFGQHTGNQAHTLQIYDENVRVPLIVRPPGGTAPRRIARVAGAIDLAPTVLDLAGLPPAAGVEGESLLLPRPGLARFFVDHGVTMLGLREGTHKVILDHETGRAKLFDLATDPDERVNLAAQAPAAIARYRAHLEAWAAHRRARILAPAPAPIISAAAQARR